MKELSVYFVHFVDCKEKEKKSVLYNSGIRSSTSNNVFHKIKGMCEVFVVVCY